MKTRNSRFIAKSTGVMLASLMVANVSATDSAVKIGVPSWSAGEIIAYNLGLKIQSELNMEVEYVDLEGLNIFGELDKDNGAIDIFPDSWMPNQQDNWDKYVDGTKTVRVNSSPYIGKQGFHVFTPGSTPLTSLSLDDMSRPDVIAMFDSDNDGKGEFWPGADGWNSKHFSKLKIFEHGLSEDWVSIEADDTEFLAILEERKETDKPIVFYYWKPEWLFAKFDSFQVDEPTYTEGCMAIEGDFDDSDWMEKSSFDCNYPDSKVYVLFRDELEGALGELIEDFSVSPERLEYVLLQRKEQDLDATMAAALLNAVEN